MAQWSGTQSGWNSRGTQGQSLREQVALHEETDENSWTWQHTALDKLEQLKAQLGTDNYRLWAELTWPSDSIDDVTWKQIYRTGAMALSRVETLWLDLECDCNGVTGPCKVCQAQSRLAYRDNITADRSRS